MTPEDVELYPVAQFEIAQCSFQNGSESSRSTLAALQADGMCRPGSVPTCLLVCATRSREFRRRNVLAAGDVGAQWQLSGNTSQ